MSDKNKYFTKKSKFEKSDPLKTWLQTTDIPDEGLTVTILEVKDVQTTIKKNEPKELRPCLKLKWADTEKLYIVRNFTSFNAIVTVIGEEDVENWVGKEITFIVVSEISKNDNLAHEYIRVKLPRKSGSE